MQFTINSTKYEVVQFDPESPIKDIYGKACAGKWVWIVDEEDRQGKLCNTALEAQQDAIRHASELEEREISLVDERAEWIADHPTSSRAL